MVAAHLDRPVACDLGDNVIGVITADDLKLLGELLALRDRLVDDVPLDHLRNQHPSERDHPDQREGSRKNEAPGNAATAETEHCRLHGGNIGGGIRHVWMNF